MLGGENPVFLRLGEEGSSAGLTAGLTASAPEAAAGLWGTRLGTGRGAFGPAPLNLG